MAEINLTPLYAPVKSFHLELMFESTKKLATRHKVKRLTSKEVIPLTTIEFLVRQGCQNKRAHARGPPKSSFPKWHLCCVFGWADHRASLRQKW